MFVVCSTRLCSPSSRNSLVEWRQKRSLPQRRPKTSPSSNAPLFEINKNLTYDRLGIKADGADEDERGVEVEGCIFPSFFLAWTMRKNKSWDWDLPALFDTRRSRRIPCEPFEPRGVTAKPRGAKAEPSPAPVAPGETAARPASPFAAPFVAPCGQAKKQRSTRSVSQALLRNAAAAADNPAADADAAAASRRSLAQTPPSERLSTTVASRASR